MAAAKGCRAPFFTTRVGSSVVSHEPPDVRSRRGPGGFRSEPRSQFKDSYSEFARHLHTILREDRRIETVHRGIQAQPGLGDKPGGGGYVGKHGVGRHGDIEDMGHPHRQELRHLLKGLAQRTGLGETAPEIQRLETFFVERFSEREHEIQQIQLEQFETDTQNGQLRSALRASASALQHAATLMPPDMGFEIEEDEYLKQIQDLQNEVRDKDSKLLTLAKGTKEAQSLATRAEKTLQKALGKWAPSAIPLELTRETFQAWAARARNGDVQQKKAEEKFKAALARGKESMQTGINLVVGGLAQNQAAQVVRTALEAWRSLMLKKRFETDKKKMQQEQVQRTLMHWGGDFPKTAKPACFNAWRRLLDRRRQDKKEAEQRQEHLRVSKEMEKQALARATLIMTADVGKLDGDAIRVMLRAWQKCMIDTRAQKALDEERQRAEEREAAIAADMKESAKRRAAFLIVEGQRPMLQGVVAAWRSAVAASKRKEEEIRRSNLQMLMSSWRTLVIAGRRSKELEKEKAILQKEKEDFEAELQAARKKTARYRGAIGGMAGFQGKEDPSVMLRLVWQMWEELLKEKRLEEERFAERKKWEEEFQARQQEELVKYRQRQSLLAFEVAGKADGAQSELMLRLVWQSWIDHMNEVKRDERLDVQQRAFEDDMLKAQQEAEQLQVQATKQFERHRDTTHQRQVAFLMSMEGRDATLLLQVSMSAWREVMLDRRNAVEVTELKERLSHMESSIQQAAQAAAERFVEPEPKSGPDDVVPVKPGCCERFFRCCMPVKSRSGRPTAVWGASSPGPGKAPPQSPVAAASSPVKASAGGGSMGHSPSTPSRPPTTVHQPLPHGAPPPGSAPSPPGSPLPAGESLPKRPESSSLPPAEPKAKPPAVGLKRLDFAAEGAHRESPMTP